MPLTAMLFASVPPAVNTTSAEPQPTARATRSRDSSTARRAFRPEACRDEGLPGSLSNFVMAATASGSIGVVAALSKYATYSF